MASKMIYLIETESDIVVANDICSMNEYLWEVYRDTIYHDDIFLIINTNSISETIIKEGEFNFVSMFDETIFKVSMIECFF